MIPANSISGQTIVLVHGAWHGGWCWDKVTPILQNAGCIVHTPTLTGLGHLQHLGGPHIGLETHIDDITNFLVARDLSNVVLVGHSYAGIVIGGVADRIPERIGRLVYLDAYVPVDGKSMNDLRDEGPIKNRSPENWALAVPSARRFDIKDPGDLHWVQTQLTPHPFKTFCDRISLKNTATVPASYIMCTQQEGTFATTADACRQKGWPVFEIATGHDCMVTAPAELAEILLRLCGRD